jgi:hypothetical protein
MHINSGQLKHALPDKIAEFMPFDMKRFNAEGVYESRQPAGLLAADLDQIQSMAAVWQKSRKRLALWATIAWAVGLICFATGVLWWAGVILFASGFWPLYSMNRYPKAVDHLERCAFGKSIAAMLAPDADLKKPVSMRLAFDPKPETLAQGAIPHRTGKQNLYKLSWFSMEASLDDGTTISETIEDLVRERTVSNPRGKSKTKTRAQHLIAMRFDYPPETYGDLTPFRDKMQKEIQVPGGAMVRALEVSEKAVKVKAVVTMTGGPGSARSVGAGSLLSQTSAMLALGVYRMLNLSREVEARKRAQAKRGGPQ